MDIDYAATSRSLQKYALPLMCRKNMVDNARSRDEPTPLLSAGQRTYAPPPPYFRLSRSHTVLARKHSLKGSNGSYLVTRIRIHAYMYVFVETPSGNHDDVPLRTDLRHVQILLQGCYSLCKRRFDRDALECEL